MHRFVFVVDDDSAVRQSLRMLLESAGHEVQDFDSAEGFLEAYQDSAAGCVIADIRMPGRSGLELQRVLAERGVALPVIMLTGHADVPSAVQSMKAGAVDFLQKPYEPQQLLDQVARAMELGSQQRDARGRRVELERRAARLTHREREVIAEVARGHSNKVIAVDLEISERTVELHRARGMKKMEVRTVADLVRCFSELEII